MPEKKTVEIIIDIREDAQYERGLAALGAAVKRQTLSVGDFVLSERLCAERKTRDDFEASIIDGRLFEQAGRLVEAYARAVMIIEGERGDGRIRREALLGAYASLASDFGISLFFCKNASGSCELLHALAKHEQIASKQVMRVMAKPKMLTMEQNQLAAIEVLPNIGPKMARKLLEHFGSPLNVLMADEKKLMEVEGMGEKKAKMIRKVLDSVYEIKDVEN